MIIRLKQIFRKVSFNQILLSAKIEIHFWLKTSIITEGREFSFQTHRISSKVIEIVKGLNFFTKKNIINVSLCNCLTFYREKKQTKIRVSN